MAEKGSSFKDKENGLAQEFNVASKMSKHKLEKKPMKTVTLTSVSLAKIVDALGPWDPLKSTDWDEEPPSSQCLLRIKRDIMSIYQSPPPGMFIYPDEKVMTKVHALLTGPFDTPYEGGFFYFVLRCPPDYPIRPPRVKLMTTGESKVRFNPNLYRNGKVCLSILGTWSGPAWSPAQSLSSVLISIQSLLNEKPYFNEPGFEKERYPGDSNRLNEILRHETLRVAVCDMMERTTTDSKDCPDALKEVMDSSFLEFMDFYNSTITQNIHLTGHKMMDPFRERRGSFDFKSIKERIEVIHAEIKKKKEAKDDKAKKDQQRTEEWLSDCSSDGS